MTKISARIGDREYRVLTRWVEMRGHTESKATSELIQIAAFGIESFGDATPGVRASWEQFQAEISQWPPEE